MREILSRSHGNRGIPLEELVYSTNDFIERHGSKGRFAALIVRVVNTRTGECRLCHAGDSRLTLFDGKRACTKMLRDKPTVGIPPSEIVKMQNGYEQVILQLDLGGAVFLFRDSSFHPVACDFVNEKGGNAHGDSHYIGMKHEGFGFAPIPFPA